MMMKPYESPSCEIDIIQQEKSFVTGASTEGYPVTPVNPFGPYSTNTMEEDDYE